MNPAYFLAIKLGIPVIVQPEWNKSNYFLTQGEILVEEGRRIQKEIVLRIEDTDLANRKSILKDNELTFSKGTDAIKNGNKISRHGAKLYQIAVSRELGPEYVERIDWDTGEIRPL